MKNITIRDVARECGVSTQTISRVINESQNVNEKTRKLVKVGTVFQAKKRTLWNGKRCKSQYRIFSGFMLDF